MAASVSTLIRRLKKGYPNAHCALDHSNAFELLVATVLSAQCTDVRVNIVTKDLFAKFKSPKDYANASLLEIENVIRPTGFFRAKAKSLKGLSQKILSEYDGEIPRQMESLVELPGVGRKTANVVLGNAFGIASGVVVDTHVKRLSFRLGLTKNKTPEKVEQDLNKLIPKTNWIVFSHWLILHGRSVCLARKPRCETCQLNDICPKKGVKAPSRK